MQARRKRGGDITYPHPVLYALPPDFQTLRRSCVSDSHKVNITEGASAQFAT